MAFSSPHYTTSEPPLEVRYFYHRVDTRKVDTICNVLCNKYCFLNLRPGGDISDLRSGLPKSRGFIPLLFLSNTSLEHSLILSELYKTGINVESLRVCMLDNLVDDVSTLRLVDDRKHLIDASKSASIKHVAFLIVKGLIPDEKELAILILRDVVNTIMASNKFQLCPDLQILVESDKSLGPIFQVLRSSLERTEMQEVLRLRREHKKLHQVLRKTSSPKRMELRQVLRSSLKRMELRQTAQACEITENVCDLSDSSDDELEDFVDDTFLEMQQGMQSVLRSSEITKEHLSSINVKNQMGLQSLPLLKNCTPEDIISQIPIWKGQMKMLLVLTNQVTLGIKLEEIENLAAHKTEEPLPSTSAKQENTECGDWDRFFNEDNTLGLYYLLIQRQFPSKQQLAETCEKFGRKSKFFTNICDLIGYYINKYLVANYIVWPAYKVENEKHIIFVTDYPNFEQISDLEIKYWNVEMADSENSDVIKKAVEDNTMIPDEWMALMKNQINNHSAVIREKNKNIRIITASPFRSKGYKTGKHEMITENCMVLLVPLKGFIPIQEDPIPKVIGGIKTDVREDSFQWHVGGNPFIEHNDLKMGCAIGSSTLNATGTLGGFVEHPEHGLCAITCAHVLLDESEMHLFRSAKFKQNKPRVFDPSRLFPNYFDRECVQPNNSIAVFGKLKRCIWEDRGIEKPGIDVALIKVEARFPISGYFPDIDHTELKETGFKEGNSLKYTSGKVCLDIKAHKRCHLVKYGATTTLTHGVFGFNGLDLAYKPVHYSNRLVMRNQIQVNHIYNCQPFSKPGDSGSLVFIVLDNELVAAGLLLGGGKGFSVVTPICDVLQAVGCERSLMKTFPDINVDGICSNGKEAMEVDLENATNTLSDGVPQLSMLPISEVV